MTTTPPLLDIQPIPLLSPKQLAVAVYMRSYLAQNDNMPSIQQIAEDFCFESTNAASDLKKALQRKGVLEMYTDHEDGQGGLHHHGRYRFARTALGAAHLRTIDLQRKYQSVDTLTAVRLQNAIYDKDGAITKEATA